MRKTGLIILFVLTVASIPVMAFSQEIEKSDLVEYMDGKSYYMHTVEQGQTLYSLSKAYDIPVDEIAYENPDASNTLAIGQVLRIPVKSRDKEISDNLRKGEFRFIYHIVKKGETLYGISRIYDVDVDALKAANPEWSKGLNAGQYLKIPLKEQSLNEENTAQHAEASANIHFVKEGETLYSISRKYQISIQALKAVNPRLGNDLQPGQNLRIPDKDVPALEKPEQKKYYEHTVSSKETLYGIATEYRISIDSLKAFNPGLTEYIHPGEVIRIPAKVNQSEYITHRVREKTKLKKIASNYSVSVSSMKNANPEIGNRVYPGELLKVPVGPPPEEEPDGVHLVVGTPDPVKPEPALNDSIRCYQGRQQYGKEYRVALMIPLYAEEARNIKLNGDEASPDPAKFKSFNFIHFYEGFLMALEEMKESGLNVKLHVYDVDEKVSKTISVLQQPELKSMDLIIGPFFSRNFKLVSNFAEMFDIMIVNPLTRRTEVLNNRNVFKMKPSRDVQPALLAKFVDQYYKNSNVILVRNNKFKFSNQIQEVKSRLEKVVPYGVNIANSGIYNIIEDYSKADTNLSPGALYSGINVENRLISTENIEGALTDSTFFTNGISEVIYAIDSVGGIIKNASIARNNLIVVLSNNEIFVPEVLTRLNDLKDTFDITVVGMPEWELLDNLETDYLLDLRVYFFSDSYYDYESPAVQHFVEGFRQRYKTQPNQFAFEAYDLANFFMGAISQFGPNCARCISYYNARLLKSTYRLAPAYPAGYENLFWNICRYRNYKIEKLPDLK